MKNITLQDLEKILQGYIVQREDTKKTLFMLEGAIQATDSLIKFAKDEVQMETITPK